jgi:hypothetical protein
MTQTTGDTAHSQTFEQAWDSGSPLLRAVVWSGALVVVLVTVLVAVVVSLSHQVSELRDQVASSSGGGGFSSSADLTPVQVQLNDLCRRVGGVTARSGGSINDIFPNGEAVGECEAAAQLGAHAVQK